MPALLLAAAGCASAAGEEIAVAPDPPGCPEIVARAAGEGWDTPQPSYSFVVAPPPAPRALRGAEFVLRFRVDRDGRVDASSVRIEGPPDAAYHRRLAEMAARWRFQPARIQGCRVPAETAVRLVV